MLIEGVPLEALGYGSGWAIVGFFVIQIFRGRWIPVAEVDKALEKVEHDRDEWRAAHRISEQARLEEREHSAALVHDIAEPVKGLLGSVRQAAIQVRSEVDQ